MCSGSRYVHDTKTEKLEEGSRIVVPERCCRQQNCSDLGEVGAETIKMDNKLWSGMTDKELNCAYEDFLTTVSKQTVDIQKEEVKLVSKLANKTVNCRSKLRRFDQLEDRQISGKLTASWALQNKRLSYSNTGCWCFFYDYVNFDQAWTKITQLYQSNLLFGVLKLAKANNFSMRNPNQDSHGCPILAFTGPCEEKEYVLQVGKRLIESMNFTTRQRCSKNYPQKIYFKRTKRDLLFENGPKRYELPYK